MVNGIGDKSRLNEFMRTFEHLTKFVKRENTKLPELGPTVLPLTGKARPFELGYVINHSSETINLNDFRAN
jgi:hypothetical protein